MSEKNQKINNLIDSSIHNLDNLADVNTVIGKPIPGTACASSSCTARTRTR